MTCFYDFFFFYLPWKVETRKVDTQPSEPITQISVSAHFYTSSFIIPILSKQTTNNIIMISVLQYATAVIAINDMCAFCWLQYYCSHSVLILLKSRCFCRLQHFSPHFLPLLSSAYQVQVYPIAAGPVTTSYTSLLVRVLCVCDSMCLWWNQQDVQLHWLSWCI